MKPPIDHPSVWLGRESEAWRQSITAVSTGFAVLDRALPSGGWPQGQLCELLVPGPGHGELRLMIPLMQHITHAEQSLAFIAPPYQPYGLALAQRAVAAQRCWWLQTDKPEDAYWAAEQIVESSLCRLVMLWDSRRQVATKPLRRLQLVAERRDAWVFLVRPSAAAKQSSPAPTRLQLSSVAQGLQIDISKSRGSLGTQSLFVAC